MRGNTNEEKDINPLHCVACNKTFANDNVFQHHKKGKVHIRAVNELSKKGGLQQTANGESDEGKSEFTLIEIEKLTKIARLETWVMRLKDLLSDILYNTENLVRKK